MEINKRTYYGIILIIVPFGFLCLLRRVIAPSVGDSGAKAVSILSILAVFTIPVGVALAYSGIKNYIMKNIQTPNQKYFVGILLGGIFVLAVILSQIAMVISAPPWHSVADALASDNGKLLLSYGVTEEAFMGFSHYSRNLGDDFPTSRPGDNLSLVVTEGTKIEIQFRERRVLDGYWWGSDARVFIDEIEANPIHGRTKGDTFKLYDTSDKPKSVMPWMNFTVPEVGELEYHQSVEARAYLDINYGERIGYDTYKNETRELSREIDLFIITPSEKETLAELFPQGPYVYESGLSRIALKLIWILVYLALGALAIWGTRKAYIHLIVNNSSQI